MPDEGETTGNPFIRFKDHVNHYVGVTLQGLTILPALLSRHPEIHIPDIDEKAVSAAMGAMERNNGLTSAGSRDNQSGADATAIDMRDPLYSDLLPTDPSLLSYNPTRYTEDEWLARCQGAEWSRFQALSPRSPWALRHLRQPVPADLDPSLRAQSPFTFEDALEDLMAVSSGGPLPSLLERAITRRDSATSSHAVGTAAQLLGLGWPSLSPPSGRSTLLDAIFPRERLREQLHRTMRAHGRSLEEFRSASALPQSQRTSVESESTRDWDPLVTFAKRLEEQRKGLLEMGVPDSVLDHISSIFGGAARPRLGDPSRSKERGADGGCKVEQETEADIYSSLDSLFAGGERPLSVLLKTVQEESSKLEGRANAGFSSATDDEWTTDGDKRRDPATKKQSERKEWVDSDGNKHVVVTESVVDVNGRTMATRTSHTMRGGTLTEAEDATGRSEATSVQDHAPVGSPKRGWFWN